MRTLLAALLIAAPAAMATVPIASTRYAPSTVVRSATVVHGAHEFLAAWSTKSDIRVVRIADRPQPPDLSIVVLPGNANDGAAIAPVDDGFFVASVTSAGRVLGRFLDADGPAGDPFPIAQNALPTGYAIVAANRTRIFVGYTSAYGGLDAAVLDHSGRLIATKRDVLYSGPGWAVAGNDDGFLAVASGVGTTGARVANDGTASVPFAIDDAPSRIAAVASNGHDFMVVIPTLQQWDVRLVAISGDAVIPGARIRKGTQPQVPSIAWDGSAYRCVYGTDGNIMQFFVDGNGALIGDVSAFRYNTYASSLSVAVDGPRSVVVWIVDDLLWPTLVASFDGRPEREISFSAVEQKRVVTATNGDATLIAWVEERIDRDVLMCGIRREDGRWSERALLESPYWINYLSVSAGGSGFVVVANQPPAAIRLSIDGVPLDASPIAIPGNMDAVEEVAWNGSAWAITGWPPAVALLNADGSTGSVTSPASWLRSSIAAIGSRFILAHYHTFGACSPDCTAILEATFLGPTLQPIGATMTIDATLGFNPVVAASNDMALVVFDRTLHSSYQVVASRITSDGTLLDPNGIVIDSDEAYGTVPTVAWNGDVFGVVWRRSDGATMMATVSPAGRVSAPLHVADLHSTTTPQAAPLASGDWLLAGSDRIEEPPWYGSEHVVTEMIGTPESLMIAPRLISVSQMTDGTVLLQWQAGDALAAGYRIEYRADSGAWHETGDALPNVLRGGVQGLQFGLSYTFRIRAIGSNGASPYSNEVSFVPRVRRRAG